jgi:hypothetical protein
VQHWQVIYTKTSDQNCCKTNHGKTAPPLWKLS